MDRLTLELVEGWQHNIPKFAWDNFGIDLEDWQRDVGHHVLAKPKARVGMQAAVGVGKSLEEAVVAWHFQSTNSDKDKYPDKYPNGYCLSISGDNLKSGLWKELGILYERSPFLQSQFIYTAEQIVHREHPLTWWLKARSYAKSANPDQQGATLSGLHGPYLGVFLDEVGEMHPAIGRKAEQILSDAECERGIILAAGNPTSTTGLLYDIATNGGRAWDVVRITGDPDDPKRSKRVDIEWARQQIERYGRDNPWVMAHILGLFPPGGLNTLLSPDEVRAAMDRNPQPDEYEWAQKRLGIDVARFGDDRTVLFPRQGIVAFRPVELRQKDTNFIAAHALQVASKWRQEVTMIDDTGHWGHGVVDNLLASGQHVIPVNFADRKVFVDRYFNRRTEMWFEMAEWIKSRGALPNVPELVAELTAPTYYFHEGKVRLVEKDIIKETLGRSPDCFVAGTLVRTPWGNVPIETLRAGDVVATPMGPRTIVKVWETDTDELTTATLTDGRTLTGKGKHEVFTWDKGWVRLDSLALVNDIECDSLYRRLLWACANTWCTRDADSSFKAQVATTKTGTRLRRSDFYTGGYGSTITALFRKVWSCITRTATGATTTSPTWSYASHGNTSVNICWSEWPTQTIVTRQWLGWRKRVTLPPSGIAPRLAGRGTPNTASARGKGAPHSQPSAACVTASMQLSSPADPVTAPAPASNATVISGGRWRRVRVRIAAAWSWLTSIVAPRIAVASVQSKRVPPARVYNLTLDRDNVYYANGVLVANCADALALTFAIPDQPGGFTIDEAIASGTVKGFDRAAFKGRIVTDDDVWDGASRF